MCGRFTIYGRLSLWVMMGRGVWSLERVGFNTGFGFGRGFGRGGCWWIGDRKIDGWDRGRGIKGMRGM